MIFAVFGSQWQDSSLDKAAALFAALARHPYTQLRFESGFLDYLISRGTALPDGCVTRLGDDAPLEGTDMVLSLGGDGTFLHTAREVAPRQIPVLGINTGHLGYLSASALDRPDEIADNIFRGRYRIENRNMLRACLSDACEATRGGALNEIAVLKRDSASMVTVEAHVNGNLLATYRADGLLISTPTGSTAYNLSAGGPILAPGTGVWVIAPICAHTLTMRPLVIPDSSVVTLRVTSRTPSFLLSYDGTSRELPSGIELTIDKAPYVTRMVTGAGRNFIDTLRDKLLWDA